MHGLQAHCEGLESDLCASKTQTVPGCSQTEGEAALFASSEVKNFRSSLVVQWVKDPATSMQQLGLLLWLRFDPWPGTFFMPSCGQKIKIKN